MRAAPSVVGPILLSLALGLSWACGNEGNDGSRGAAGASGHQGAAGESGGSAGRGGGGPTVPPSPECVQMCAHVYGMGCGFRDQISGHEASEEDCQQFCTADYPLFKIECMSQAPECTSAAFDRCQVPERSRVCDEVCDYVYGTCGLDLSGEVTYGPETVDLEACKVWCPAELWSRDLTVTGCLTTFECSEGMTEAQKRDAMKACIHW